MTSFPTKWYCCFVVLLLFSLQAYSQINITGRVVDENNDRPLPGASVYFNNTTIGTYTNQQGEFYFDAINLLNTELVISYPGYELLVYKPIEAQIKGKKILFKLQINKLAQKTKLQLGDEVRKGWLNVFYQSFLGNTEEASKATITNAQQIYFTEGNSKSSIAAYADTPLVIINKMLGYKISYNLVEFLYDDATGQNYFYGYARYDEPGDSKRWIKNRQRCYYGSTLHFYRSLIAHDLYRQGFGVFLLQPVKDTLLKSNPVGDANKLPFSPVVPVPMTEVQILYIDSTNNYSIRLNGQLLVQYNKNTATQNYLNQQIYMEGNLDKGVESRILFKTSPIELNSEGVPSDATSIEYTGYWMYEKLANKLPYNYQPD
jgi:hypothetical protein